jgi:hypothetical protein
MFVLHPLGANLRAMPKMLYAPPDLITFLQASEQKPVALKSVVSHARMPIKINIYYFAKNSNIEGRFFGKKADFG